jgi:hypothetical protein
MEWRTTLRRDGPAEHSSKRSVGPVAVVQISNGECSLVLRVPPLLCAAEKQGPEEYCRHVRLDMLHLLHDPLVIKAGVGILADKKKFERDYEDCIAGPIEGCVDLVALQQHALDNGWLDHSGEHPPQSLRAMALCHAGLTLEKDVNIATSDWESTAPLSSAQIAYAADDAHASFAIFVGMIERIHRTSAARELSTAAGLRSLGEHEPQPPEILIDNLVDVEPRGTSRRAKGATAGKQDEPTTRFVERAISAYDCRKMPYYDNIRVHGPDGRLLFTIDRRKADWYVRKKQLATVTEWRVPPPNGHQQDPTQFLVGQPQAIQLTFTPDLNRFCDLSVRRDMDYFKREKENRCVVCGVSGQIIRVAVVPLMYRKHLPASYVAYNSYDMLLACPQCFAKINFLYDRERELIAREYGFPLATNRRPVADSSAASDSGSETNEQFRTIQQHRRVVNDLMKYAAALLRADEHSGEEEQRPSGKQRRKSNGAGWMPAKRREELQSFVQGHVRGYTFTVDPEEQRVVGDDPLSLAALRVVSRANLHQVVSRKIQEAFPPESGDKEVTCDSHPAFVVRTLMAKFPVAGDHLGRTPDHAVGDFIYRWRKLFVEKLRPRFLPLGWDPKEGILTTGNSPEPGQCETDSSALHGEIPSV